MKLFYCGEKKLRKAKKSKRKQVKTMKNGIEKKESE